MSETLREMSHGCFSRILDKLNAINHIQARNTTYCKHFLVATSMGVEMIKGGLALVIHSVFPNCFESTGSDIIKKLNKDITTSKQN
jgi:hypothetical protein